jgi:hypothetical protein
VMPRRSRRSCRSSSWCSRGLGGVCWNKPRLGSVHAVESPCQRVRRACRVHRVCAGVRGVYFVRVDLVQV